MSKKKEYIAIISEGEKTEKQIINNLVPLCERIEIWEKLFSYSSIIFVV